MKKSISPSLLLILVIGLSSFIFLQDTKPTLYIIGDSTVRNANTNGLWGWGSLIENYLDTTKIVVSNQAMAGRSTRTFLKEGRWDKVLSTLKKGDFVMIQFGHNEGSKPDTTKAGYRGVLNGTGEETKELIWPDGKPETVHTYGWYLRKFVRDAQAKGAEVYICSMIPRNDFKEGKVLRADQSYGKWAKEVAAQEHAFFIDLNTITADKYDMLGADKVKNFFPKEHTHTNKDGANINAQSVITGLQQLNNAGLAKFILK
ncbi:MAG: rhamnogalacturonan acetylesterase [Bacteroidota bacterium]|nr:rhamnogalacturonan acetylesterase [Bacteroidota bacterium]